VKLSNILWRVFKAFNYVKRGFKFKSLKALILKNQIQFNFGFKQQALGLTFFLNLLRANGKAVFAI
jgi:hypothetical protein